ncbi:MAG TPA: DMT family transporter [archaeon]|nr:DMT family transporter [archaeon]
MKREVLGTILALVAALLSGIAIPINKMFIVDLDPTIFTAVRALFIGIIFFMISSFKSGFNFKKFKKVSWMYLLAIGVIGGSFAFLMFFSGLKLTTAGRGAFIHKTLPLYATLLAFLFLKEKLGKNQLIALTVMFAGTILIYMSQINPAEFWTDPSLGDLLITGATILWAIESVIAKKAMIKGESNYVVSFARMFIGAIILFSVVLIQSKINLLFALTQQQILSISISIAVLFGFVLSWYWSIKLINVSKASTLLLLSPVISLFFGILFFNEPTPFDQILGSALILIGAYFVSRVKSEFETGV